MKILLTVVLVVHGAIHLMGFAKAYGLATLAQLSRPISRRMGALWLVTAALFITTAIALQLSSRWWAVGALAVLLSQAAILSSWSDARFGTWSNGLVLLAVVHGFLSLGPTSLRAEYRREVERGLDRVAPEPRVTDADLAHLPAPVQRYLRVTGAVGQPRVHNFRARWRGRFRSAADARWMNFTAEQHNFVGPPARLFFMEASLFGVPFEARHLYVGPDATMRVKIASLWPLIDARGPEMNQGETVTLFNDMCVMAPATLIDPAVRWDAVDTRAARATFTNAGQIIRAELSFNDAGELVDFWSDDRFMASPNGRSFRRIRWSTPLRGGYRTFGAHRLTSFGEARWHAPEGTFAYGEFELVDIAYNVGSQPGT
jgi:hypothetical protein